MSKFAKASKAFGYCDLTGFRYPLKELVPQIVNRKPSGLRVGRDVVDIDHEQLQLGDVIADEPYPLENPRPDPNLVESRGLAAWNPVGGGVTELGSRTVGLSMRGHVGMVKVVIS